MQKKQSQPSLLGSLVQFSMDLHYLDWGFVNFLFEVGLVIVGIIWVCIHHPGLISPLLGWVALGFIIFLILMAIAMSIAHAITGWLNTKHAYIHDKTQYYQDRGKDYYY